MSKIKIQVSTEIRQTLNGQYNHYLRREGGELTFDEWINTQEDLKLHLKEWRERKKNDNDLELAQYLAEVGY